VELAKGALTASWGSTVGLPSAAVAQLSLPAARLGYHLAGVSGFGRC
jgi:hypothetical protein